MISRNKRNELEILEEMLSLATKEVKKTRLMYEANLSYTLCNKYLDFLLEKKFLGEKFGNPSGKVYYTTEKGKKFHENIKDILYQVNYNFSSSSRQGSSSERIP